MRLKYLTLAVIFALKLTLDETNAECTASEGKLPRDCKEIYDRGCQEDGVYTINPECPNMDPFEVRCDMKNGQWIVFQRRKYAILSFARNWTDYENGFGNLTFDFWLGLKKLHCLTFRSCTVAFRVDMTNSKGVHKYANYTSIAVHNAANKYRLDLGTYSGGDAGDSLKGKDCLSRWQHDGMYFSTPDNDNDQRPGNCAQLNRDGWWYNDCECAALNRAHGPYASYWHTFSKELKCTEMKLQHTKEPRVSTEKK